MLGEVLFCMFFSRLRLKIHECTWLVVSTLFFTYSGTAKKTPQQESKLERDCIQSLEENLCGFHENHLSIDVGVKISKN